MQCVLSMQYAQMLCKVGFNARIYRALNKILFAKICVHFTQFVESMTTPLASVVERARIECNESVSNKKTIVGRHRKSARSTSKRRMFIGTQEQLCTPTKNYQWYTNWIWLTSFPRHIFRQLDCHRQVELCQERSSHCIRSPSWKARCDIFRILSWENWLDDRHPRVRLSEWPMGMDNTWRFQRFRNGFITDSP